MVKILVLMLLFVSGNATAGARQLNAVQNKNVTAKNDTTRINEYLNIATSYFDRGNGNISVLDSGYTYTKRALELSTRIHNEDFQNRSMQLIGYYFYLSGVNTRAIQIQKQFIRFCHKKNQLYREAEAWDNLAFYFLNLDSVHLCCQHAQALYNKAGHPVEAITELKSWGDNLLRAQKLDSAEHVLKEVLRRYRAIGYNKLQYTYDLLAVISYNRGDLKSDLAYRLEVIKYVEYTGDMTYAGSYYYRVAYSYAVLNQLEKSISYAKQAVAIEGKKSYMCMDLIVTDFLDLRKPNEALAYLKNYVKMYPPATDHDKVVVNGALSHIYTNLGQYQQAEKFILKTLAAYDLHFIYNKIETSTRVTNYVGQYERLINLYILTRKFKQARYYLNKIPKNFAKSFTPQGLIDLELIRFKVDSASANYISAIRHYQLYKKINDSVFSLKNLRSIKEVETKYQTEKKEHTIKLLQSEKSVQKITIQRAILQRNVTLAAIIFALLLTGFAYNGYRRKQFSNLLINKKNHQLQILLNEKEWLLKEVHHRVKNNLHTVICLLESQAMYLENDALKAVENSRHRIYAMSLIHQKLYQSDDIKVVNMKTYLTDFIVYLEESFGAPENVKIRLNAEEIMLSAGQAIPIGLIVNEAVTNAFKYAFPDQKNGEIRVILKKLDDEIYLSVADNGIGFKQTNKEANSLGLELIKGLALDLRGELVLKSVNGTNIQIRFKNDPVGIPADEEGIMAMSM
jgi:two-component sensor histidine kinase